MATSAKLPFDRVVVTVDGVQTQLTIEKFLALPLNQRTRHILKQELEFFVGRQSVSQNDALEGLRAYWASFKT